MRGPNNTKSQTPARPRVALFVESNSTYGRAIIRGVTRYANLQRRWLIYKDIHARTDIGQPSLRFDGGLFAGVGPDLVQLAIDRCRHLVSCSSSTARAMAVVALDDEVAGKQAAEHLIDCQLRRFSFYAVDKALMTTVRRARGFCRELESRGFSYIECPLALPTPEKRKAHVHRPDLIAWLRSLPKPVGIMAWDDTSAYELSEACMEADIGVPEHVAIVGVNNDDLLCEGAWPPLSSVDADYTRMGYCAGRLLDRMMGGEVLSAEDRETLLPPLGVVRRQSTSVLAVDDPNLAGAVRYIREHACDPCTVRDVLRRLPVGRRWLERNFAAQFGRTLHDEIARVRIETARRLLLQPDLTLPEIGKRCGYGTLASFHAAFRQLVNDSPASYRRSAKRPPVRIS